MKKTINSVFGKFENKKGKTVEKKIHKVATLKNKPFRQFKIGLDTKRNVATIGTKFIADDPKKALILKSYTKDLAQRLLIKLFF